LQDGLLMAVENVHEKLRVARGKHRVMVGNPVTETSAQNFDVAGVTVLGYDECHEVLPNSENFSSSCGCVLNAFSSTGRASRRTFGEGSPPTRVQYDNSGTLRQLESNEESATLGSRWSGAAATAHGSANTEHRRFLGRDSPQGFDHTGMAGSPVVDDGLA
jgi:hypothetical protein